MAVRYVKAFAAAAAVFLVIDIAWISLFLGDVYDAQLGSMMRPSASAWAAALFYVGYLAAILFFAVRPALAEKRVATAALNGAVVDAIVVGGGVAHAGEVLFDPLRERIRVRLSKEFFERLSIVPAEMGNTAGIIGSAALALEGGPPFPPKL